MKISSISSTDKFKSHSMTQQQNTGRDVAMFLSFIEFIVLPSRQNSFYGLMAVFKPDKTADLLNLQTAGMVPFGIPF